MPLKHRDTCLYCGGKNWVVDRHWKICADCNPKQADAARRNNFRPTLFEKGIPRRNP